MMLQKVQCAVQGHGGERRIDYSIWEGWKKRTDRKTHEVYFHSFSFFLLWTQTVTLRMMLHRDPLRTLCTFFTLSPFISQSKEYEYVCVHTHICVCMYASILMDIYILLDA